MIRARKRWLALLLAGAAAMMRGLSLTEAINQLIGPALFKLSLGVVNESRK